MHPNNLDLGQNSSTLLLTYTCQAAGSTVHSTNNVIEFLLSPQSLKDSVTLSEVRNPQCRGQDALQNTISTQFITKLLRRPILEGA